MKPIIMLVKKKMIFFDRIDQTLHAGRFDTTICDYLPKKLLCDSYEFIDKIKSKFYYIDALSKFP